MSHKVGGHLSVLLYQAFFVSLFPFQTKLNLYIIFVLKEEDYKNVFLSLSTENPLQSLTHHQVTSKKKKVLHAFTKGHKKYQST